MPETSFDLRPTDSVNRLDVVIGQVVERYSRTCPEALEMISIRTVTVNGELRRRVSSPSSQLIDEIRQLLRRAGGLSV